MVVGWGGLWWGEVGWVGVWVVVGGGRVGSGGMGGRGGLWWGGWVTWVGLVVRLRWYFNFPRITDKIQFFDEISSSEKLRPHFSPMVGGWRMVCVGGGGVRWVGWWWGEVGWAGGGRVRWGCWVGSGRVGGLDGWGWW